MNLEEEVKRAVGAAVKDVKPLSGGCIGQVYRMDLADGSVVVVKSDDSEQPCLDLEGYMLRYLSEESDLPTPEVWYSTERLLVMDFLPGESRFSDAAQAHAAELLADLHNISAPAFGLEEDTLIGGLHQPNPWTDSWLDFFREQRLLYMGRQGVRHGRLPEPLLQRLERFCDHLEEWLDEPERPSLLHGDVWTGNVLAQGDRITGFIDPAVYYGHAEIELAFTTLFGTFGRPFFDRYRELRPLPDGFFRERRDIYNLYPLLVHVRLFGGSYVNSVERTLEKFGF
jgi:fructosamine-3-kinase